MTRITKKTGKNREAKAPAFIAYHVMEKSEDKSFWTRIGAAWEHEDGQGLTLQLSLVPIAEGRIVLRAPATEEEKGA
jgi:hypothetical protein